jgi:hypothetical protein
MLDGSHSRRREACWEAGLGDRPACLDGEDDLQANLRVMDPIRSSSMNPWRVGGEGQTLDRIAVNEHGEAVEAQTGDLKVAMFWLQACLFSRLL